MAICLTEILSNAKRTTGLAWGWSNLSGWPRAGLIWLDISFMVGHLVHGRMTSTSSSYGLPLSGHTAQWAQLVQLRLPLRSLSSPASTDCGYGHT